MANLTVAYNGTRNDLCNAIAASIREAHELGHTGAIIGIRNGQVDWSNLAEGYTVLVENVGDLDALGVSETIDDEAEAGMAACWRQEWLREWELNNDAEIVTTA